MFNSIKYVALLLLAFAFFSCSDDTNPVNDTDEITLNTIATKTSGDYTYEIVSEETELMEGHSVFYISAMDASENSIANDLGVNLMMDMGEMMHSTPFMTEIVTMNDKEYIKVDATFIMPSTEMGQWFVTLKSEAMEIDEIVEYEVGATGNVKRFTSREKAYFVTLLSLQNPKVGMNDFMVSVHTRESMMVHPAVTDLTTEVTLLMPSMGHGSDGNVSPVHTDNGVYTGKVNFNMTGDWEITLKLMQGDLVVGEPVFELEF